MDLDPMLYPDEIFDFWLGFTGNVTDVVLLTSDEKHAELIAKLMDSSKKRGEGRISVTYEGIYKDVPIMVTSSGLGTTSTAIVAECLIKKGAKAIIRVGMAGSIRDDINPGDIVIVSGAIRDDSNSARYLDPAFPTIPDYEITESLVLAARVLGHSYKLGVVWTHDAFFLESISRFDYWAKLGGTCVDMGTAGLFAVAQVRGVKKGSILAISEPKHRNKRLGNRSIVKLLNESIQKEGEIALEAVFQLKKRGVV